MNLLPFYKQLQEVHVDLKPSMTPYYPIIAFAFCSMMVGIVVGLERGRAPSVPYVAAPETATDVVESPVAEGKKLTTPYVSKIRADFQKTWADAKYLLNMNIEQQGGALVIGFGTSEVFGKGNAVMSLEARPELEKLAEYVKTSFPGATINIEAYTDDTPFASSSASGFRSNWELSGARAARILRVFQSAGISAENLDFKGRGSTHPLVPNKDDKGMAIEKNRLMNRRVAIRITPKE